MHKKTRIFFLLTLLTGILAWSNLSFADEEGRSIKEVTSEIRRDQNLQSGQKIDCDQVTDDQYRELGEAWMDVMIPDPDQHRMMDRMMGGPGSQSLADAHRIMGMRYLGCISDDTYYGMMPGMTKGYAMGGMMYGYNGGWMHSWGGGLIMWIVLLAVIGLVVYLIVAATRSGHGTTHHISSGESAHDILKKRYAKGEISKEEFEQMKRDIS